MAAINVTPMADVIITLLIIFMVMTPMFGQDDHAFRDRRELLSKRPRPVRLEADAGLDYAQVARVLDACREAGARELVLVTRSREIP